jgi:hypothetical protein
MDTGDVKSAKYLCENNKIVNNLPHIYHYLHTVDHKKLSKNAIIIILIENDLIQIVLYRMVIIYSFDIM